MKYYLYNSLANNGIRPELKSGAELVDAVGLDYPEYLKKLSPEDEVVLIGGDGTLNYFINAVKD
ncbi:MAG: diacylglycerol kinase family protein, partial [Clostridia bacterium]|nr:diacylglycerol kinase family protein [Clostridia bacterium]